MKGRSDSTKPRILYISRSRGYGGSSIAAIRCAAAFSETHDVSLLAIQESEGERFRDHARHFGLNATTATTLGAVMALLPMLYRRFDLIHLHSGHYLITPKTALLNRLARFRGVPLVVSLHGPVLPYQARHARARAFHAAHFDNIGAVTLMSDTEAAFHIEQGIPRSGLMVIPPIMREQPPALGNRAEFDIPENATTLLFAGRIVQHKGVTELIKAFQDLPERHGNTVLIIAGDGPGIDEAKALAQGTPNVRFLGWIEMMELERLYPLVDLCVFPSHTESFGMVAVEAGVAGTPMLVSRIEPWTDMFEPDVDCGFFEAGDAPGITKAITTALDQPERARQRATHLQKKLSTLYSKETVARMYEQAYARAQQSKGSAFDRHRRNRRSVSRDTTDH